MFNKNRIMLVIALSVLIAIRGVNMLSGLRAETPNTSNKPASSPEGLEDKKNNANKSGSGDKKDDMECKCKKEDKFHIEDFGINESKPITSGFIFYDGVYIETPYVISRYGLALFINDKIIEQPIKWPRPLEPSGKIDPEMPQSITKETSRYDKVLENYLTEKVFYLIKNYGKEEASKLMTEVYKKLPCVKKVEVTSDPGCILVTWNDDQVEHTRLLPLMGRQLKFDKASVLERLEKSRNNYEERLNENEAYFFFSTGGMITMSIQGVTEKLPLILKSLRSSKTAEEKFKEMPNLGWPMVTKDNFAEIVTKFSASPRLEERLNEVITKQKEDDKSDSPPKDKQPPKDK